MLELNEEVKTYPKITQEDVDNSIIKEEYFRLGEDSTTTVCQLTLYNGFTVRAESSCVSPKNFDEEIGRSIALNEAKQKVWPYLGFKLMDNLFLLSLKNKESV